MTGLRDRLPLIIISVSPVVRFYDVAEVVGRHVESVGTVLDCGEAAVRYLSYNDARIPGNAERMFIDDLFAWLAQSLQ